MKLPYSISNPNTANLTYYCNQFTIPKLSDSGYVVIKSANKIEIFQTNETPGVTVTQEEAKGKVYKPCNSNQRWIFQKYVLPTLSVVTTAAVRGAVSGPGGAVTGTVESIVETIIGEENLLCEVNDGNE